MLDCGRIFVCLCLRFQVNSSHFVCLSERNYSKIFKKWFFFPLHVDYFLHATRTQSMSNNAQQNLWTRRAMIRASFSYFSTVVDYCVPFGYFLARYSYIFGASVWPFLYVFSSSRKNTWAVTVFNSVFKFWPHSFLISTNVLLYLIFDLVYCVRWHDTVHWTRSSTCRFLFFFCRH